MRWYHSILFRVPLALLIVGGVAVGLGAMARYFVEKTRLEDEARITAVTLGKVVAVPLADAIWTFSDEAIGLSLQSLVEHPGVRRALLFDIQGKVLAVKGSPEQASSVGEAISIPVNRYGEKLAELVIEVDTSQHDVSLAKIRLGILMEAVIFFLAVFCTLAASLYSQVLKKIRLLEEQSQMLYEKNLDSPFIWEGKGELESLGRRLEHSRIEIKKQMETLSEQKDKLLIRVEDLNLMVQKKTQEVVQSAKMAGLGVMSSGIAHEINNPLAIIQLRSQRLKEMLQGLSEGNFLVKELEKIEETSERIAKIVRGLRTFSRQSDKDPFEAVALTQVFEDVLVLCRQRFSHGGVALSIPEMAGIAVRGRPGELAQILMNLLNNAFDACQSSPDPWVRVAVFEGEARVEIRVMDSGPKISKEVQEKMMQPFFTTKDPGKGTGLGLSISMGLAQQLKGELKFERAEPTTFLLILNRHKEIRKAA
jgi:C4-dicarboxylate-specific signal transduction histidine kinase